MRLTALGKECGIQAGFHNHSGNYVGFDVRDTREILRGLDPKAIGFYFDAAHATVEGGLYGWEVAQRIALRQIKLAAMKDFSWEKTPKGWDVRWQPLGQGMVNWPKVLAAYAAARFAGRCRFTWSTNRRTRFPPQDATSSSSRNRSRQRTGRKFRQDAFRRHPFAARPADVPTSAPLLRPERGNAW